jgi:A/G-specific adenine glycosylase
MLPVARKRSAIPHSHVTAGVIRDHRGRLLIVRRPDKGLLGGLWKFPGGTQDSNQLLQRCLSKKIRDEVGIQVRVGQLIASVDHAFTHLRITLHAFQCTRRGGREQALGCVGWCWTTPQELCDFAFSRADRKIIEVLDFKGQQVEA